MMSQKSVEELLAAARAGDGNSLGALLDRHRDQLRGIARQQLDSAIKGRVDPSDVIQQTFLEAKQGFHNFRGEAAPQFFAWLKKILEHNVANTVDFHLHTAKRSVMRERKAAAHTSQTKGDDLLVDVGSSPSHRLQQSEQRELVLRIIEELPAGEQQAIRLRYLDGESLPQIAENLDRSNQAIAGLLKRALNRLREQIAVAQDFHS